MIVAFKTFPVLFNINLDRIMVAYLRHIVFSLFCLQNAKNAKARSDDNVDFVVFSCFRFSDFRDEKHTQHIDYSLDIFQMTFLCKWRKRLSYSWLIVTLLLTEQNGTEYILLINIDWKITVSRHYANIQYTLPTSESENTNKQI
jgi:hypothetical protein